MDCRAYNVRLGDKVRSLGYVVAVHAEGEDVAITFDGGSVGLWRWNEAVHVCDTERRHPA